MLHNFRQAHRCQHGHSSPRVVLSQRRARKLLVSSSAAGATASIDADAASLYTSHAYTHRRAVGPVRLDVIPGKGLGWRATRDVASGELLLASLPLTVLYGDPGEPPDGDEVATSLRQRWPRMMPYERRWLALLADCAAASGTGQPKAPLLPAAAAAVAGGAQGAAAANAPPAAAAAASLESLLRRAQELLAVGGAAVEAEQETAVADPAAMGTGWGADGIPTVAAAAPPGVGGVGILPPAIFGMASASASAGTIAGPTAALPPGSPAAGPTAAGGVIADLVARYSFAEPREDPVLTELLDLDLDLDPVVGSTPAAPGMQSVTAAARSGGSGAASVAGLWPEASLLNHSCCPNGSVLLLGGAMYVRAGRALMEGEEVTVTYLSTGLFRDVAERRRQLRSNHGFICCCPRCIAEHEHFPTRRYPELDAPRNPTQQQRQQPRPQQRQQPPGAATNDDAHRPSTATATDASAGAGSVLDDALLAESLMGRRAAGPLQRVLDWVFEAGRFRTNTAPDHTLLAGINAALAVELEAAGQAVLTAASRPRQQQAALLGRLEGLLAQVEEACEYLDLPPRGRLLTYASVYGLIRLTCDLAELSQQADPARRLALRTLAAAALEAAAPGSDAHVAAAVKAASVARGVHGAEAPPARLAELSAARAHVARYGRGLLAQPGLLRRMAATRRRLATGSSLAAAMGVLAWTQQVEGGA